MEDSDQLAPVELLAREFEAWQKTYYDDVDSHFRAMNRPRGNVAFQSWENRFVEFLDSRAPGLSEEYRTHLSSNRHAGLANLTVHQNWKRRTGEAAETFLEQCIADSRAGNLTRYIERRVALPLEGQPSAYVDEERLNQLETIDSSSFDLSRLIRLCQELNQCWSGGCYYAAIMLVRSILDHVPSVFGFATFAEVANNYSGSKSFRESMQHLENSSRKIADSALHTIMRSRESLITPTQANFSQDMDVLLSEIVRKLG